MLCMSPALPKDRKTRESAFSPLPARASRVCVLSRAMRYNAGMAHIEPVPPGDRDEAACFLAGGSRCSELVEAQGRAVIDLIDLRSPDSSALWWARSGRRCLATAIVLDSPGRVGFLFHSPTSAPGVNRQALVELLREISADAIGRGAAFVQSSLAGDQQSDEQTLCDAGFEFLAELVYMELAPAHCVQAEHADELRWLHYGQFDDGELSEVLAATYEGSLDCPLLSGVRGPADVIAGHRAGGVFRPQSWWIACEGQTPIGCVLANDAKMQHSAELIYLGVAPAFRGRGLGGVLLRRAAADAFDRGLTALTLAVDSRNHYALQLYLAEGFDETARRRAYAMFKKGLPRGDL